MSTERTLPLPVLTGERDGEAVDRPAVLPGTHYRLEGLLGDGGAGEVYRARHLELDKHVAVKVLREELSTDRDYSERFRREARAASRIDHPGVVRVTDFGAAADGRLFLVMELIEGRTLAEVVFEGPLEPPRALRIVANLCEVLVAVHRADILHRDVKPGNVFLLEDDRVKLVDFGIARGGMLGGADWRITRTGRVCGTPGYMAPEHARNKELDGRADLYSAGAVLYELLTGLPPYRGDSPVDVLLAQMNEQLVPPSTVAKTRWRIPRAVDRAVGRMLAKRASERFATAEEAAEHLRALADEIDPPASCSAEVSVPRKPGRSRRLWWLGAGLGAVSLAVGGGALVGVLGTRPPGQGDSAMLAPPAEGAGEPTPDEVGRVEAEVDPASPALALSTAGTAAGGGEVGVPEPPGEAEEAAAPARPPTPAAVSEPAVQPRAEEPAPSREEARQSATAVVAEPRRAREPAGPAEERAPERAAEPAEDPLRAARVAAVAGRAAEAERLYRQVLDSGGDRGAALAGLGRLLLAQGRHAEAVRTLQRAVAQSPGSSSLRVDLGRALEAAGQRDEAVMQWRTALRQQPANEQARRLLRSVGAAP